MKYIGIDWYMTSYWESLSIGRKESFNSFSPFNGKQSAEKYMWKKWNSMPERCMLIDSFILIRPKRLIPISDLQLISNQTDWIDYLWHDYFSGLSHWEHRLTCLWWTWPSAISHSRLSTDSPCCLFLPSTKDGYLEKLVKNVECNHASMKYNLVKVCK